MTSPQACPHFSNRACALVLLAAAVLAYANSLGVPFVYDDILAIAENPTLRDLFDPAAILKPQSAGGLTVSGRPLLNLSLALNHAISGTAPWSYHAANLLIHASAGLLLFGLVRRTLGTAATQPYVRDPRTATAVAFASALLWVLHPVHTQAVTYTVQRAESLMGFLYLLTLYAFARATGQPGGGHARRWLTLSVAACLLGMATKEVMATAPIMVLLYARTFVNRGFRAAWARHRVYFAALASTWVVLALLVASTGNRGGTAGFGTGVPVWAYPLTQFEAVARYVSLAWWPSPLVFDHGTFWVTRASQVAPHALVVVPLVIATLVALRRSPALGFCGAWFLVILAPTSLTPGTLQMIVEHRMYLPVAGLIVPAVVALWQAAGARVHLPLCLAAVALAALTVERNHEYRDALALWGDAVAKRPGNARAHDGLAEAHLKRGHIDDAVRHYGEAVRLNPRESRYHYNLALALAESGRLDEAVSQYRDSLRLNPNEPNTHNNLAIALGRLGRDDQALDHHAAAVRLREGDPRLHYNHGVALLRAGRAEDATAAFSTVLHLEPDNADAHFNLASTLVERGRPHEALPHYAAALRLKPDSETEVMLGNALLLAGDIARAIAQFESVLRRVPDSPGARFGLAEAAGAAGRTSDAADLFRSVLRDQPENAAAHFKLGNMLLRLGQPADATTHYLKALELAPGDPMTHHNLGVALAQQQRWREARRHFESALRLKPDYDDARNSLERLERLETDAGR